MHLDSPLDQTHAHLADAMLSLVRAIEDRRDFDPDEVRRVIHAIAEAQDRLLKITAAGRQDQYA